MRDGISSSTEGTSVESPASTWQEDLATAGAAGRHPSHVHDVDRRVASLHLDKSELLARKSPAWNPMMILATITFGAVVAFGLWYFGQSQRDALPTNTTALIVPELDTDVVLEMSGHIDVESTVHVNCRVRGIIVFLDIEEGQSVRQGDLLAQLDDTP